MLNLKCTYCGHLNPITSEYQTFCGGCNKKLEHNFADWHKLHPDKTFDDFTAQFGQPDEPLPPPKRRSRQSRIVKKDEHRRTKMLWGGLIGLFVLIALIILGGRYAADFFEAFVDHKTPEAYVTRPWKTTAYDKLGLTIASPVTIKEADLGFPQQLIDLTDYLKSFKTAEDEPIQVFINVTKYKPQTSLNLQNAANGAVNEMKSKADVSDFDYTERSENISGFPAIDQTGSFASPGNKKIEFRDLIIMNDHKMYQVAILYQQSDSIGRKVARRMIKSLAISN